MGTEVLRPQDCFTERMRFNPTVLPHRKPYNAGSNNTNTTKSNRKSSIVRSSESKKRVFQTESKVVDESKQITILKRGEMIQFVNKRNNENLVKKKASFSCGDLVVRVKEQQQQQNLFINSRSGEIYAGSACFSSPSPRKLPLPTFSKKNEGLKMIDGAATKDLRRLLRLD